MPPQADPADGLIDFVQQQIRKITSGSQESKILFEEVFVSNDEDLKDFLKEGQLVTAVKEKDIGIRDIGYANEHGLDL